MTFFCLDETKYEARWRRRKEKFENRLEDSWYREREMKM